VSSYNEPRHRGQIRISDGWSSTFAEEREKIMGVIFNAREREKRMIPTSYKPDPYLVKNSPA